MEKQKLTYSLYSTERIFRDETLISYYYQANKEIIKKWKPVDIDGERMRLNLETGELANYKMKDIVASENASLRRTIICMNMLLAMNDFDWFWTLTFDKERIDRTNAQAVFDCYKKYVNNIKKQYPKFRYMTFPEKHEDGCYHFHLLTGGMTPNEMGLVNSGKVCCHWADENNHSGHSYNGIRSKEFFERTKANHELTDTDGLTIYNATKFAYGLTTVSRIQSRERCNSYVKKYVEKALGSTEVFKKRFYYSNNLNIPTVVKKIMGTGYITPTELYKNADIQNDLFVKNCKGKPYINDFNVMQIKIDNSIKTAIERGYEILDSNKLPFDEYHIQEKIKL